jgi:hypothetical protein
MGLPFGAFERPGTPRRLRSSGSNFFAGAITIQFKVVWQLLQSCVVLTC